MVEALHRGRGRGIYAHDDESASNATRSLYPPTSLPLWKMRGTVLRWPDTASSSALPPACRSSSVISMYTWFPSPHAVRSPRALEQYGHPVLPTTTQSDRFSASDKMPIVARMSGVSDMLSPGRPCTVHATMPCY